jgi:uncharacterized membrane protein
VTEDSSPVETGAAERLIFFSDAVLAIAMTLLALELPVPTGESTKAFWSSVQHNAGEYIAFLVSFLVISLHWAAHHRAFRYVIRVDGPFQLMNGLWLLTMVLLPFATKLLYSDEPGAHQTQALRSSFYALLQVIAFITYLAMVHRMVSKNLVGPETPPDTTGRADWGVGGFIVGFGLSIPSFFAFRQAWVFWIAGPVIAGVLERGIWRRQRGATAD